MYSKMLGESKGGEANLFDNHQKKVKIFLIQKTFN